MSSKAASKEELLKEANAAFRKLQDIMNTINPKDFRMNEVIAKLIPVATKLSNAYPVILRHMVQTKHFYKKAAEYYITWAGSIDIKKDAEKEFEEVWEKERAKELSKILTRVYYDKNTSEVLIDMLETLESEYGFEDVEKIPENEIPKEIMTELQKVQEVYISKILIKKQAETEAKYYVYALEQESRAYHKELPPLYKSEVLDEMTKVLIDEKTQHKEDQDKRIQKIEKRDKKLYKLGREEEIRDMQHWMKNAHNAKIGVQEVELSENKTLNLLKNLIVE